ncbi:alpha/beta fold hydrolase [Noviherbaspirillum cavernae]|uniref:Alpha/beta fold hydrolase n=1 Tax=Noviherbaspirillum cavernae TaxID=2320862 RepID=A0A418WXQ9_9BURK|nr:alpha/beta fold hydrolase [Noviherbaspirillum cavernae]RJG05024.1 alpha/beta fold hydrolase [Noviherbaspirillum cavernae]
METIRFNTSDGATLTGTRFAPQGKAKAVVVLPAAMGVKQDFYIPFAQFLAEQGMAVLTFDYRGMGQSTPPEYRHSLRGFKADLYDWGERDYNAALHAAKGWQPDVPLFIVGHSLGGQLPGLLHDTQLIDGILTVAAGSGYWRDNAPQLRRFVWFLWYFAVPVYTRLFGYFPGRRVRKIGDLPRGVIYQWARWCKSPHYMVDDSGKPLRAGFERISVPLLSMSFTDDEMMSRRSIDSLHDCYKNAPMERRYIRPADVNAKRIGHFGFFRPQFKTTLWQQALDWLDQHARIEHPAQSEQSATRSIA